MELTFGTLCGGGLLIVGLFLLYAIMTGSRSLRNYVITRLLLVLPMIWILVTLVFVMMRVLPGDPISTRLKPGTDQATLDRLRERAGLDRPIYEQYWDYLNDIAHGDLGVSNNVEQDRPVTQIIGRRLPATIELVMPAITLMLIFGIAAGALSANKHKRTLDYSFRITSVVAYAVPIFWLGLMLQIVFARQLEFLPVAQRINPRFANDFTHRTNIYLIDTLLSGNGQAFGDVLKHLVLPTITLTIALIGVFIRLTRSNMIEVLQEDYVTASRARGVPERKVVYFHALRNSFIPIMTLIGLQVAVLLAGAVLTETTFSWDGLGKLLRDGIALRDYPVVQGTVVVFAITVGVMSTLTDILYAFIDPRIRF
ncbi:MAG: ABC transporter permease [Chloroflexi bacterium]|nr:ABC transporter permease [Chloroflexota bacterium]